jgi:hypothetical protein
MPMWRCPHCGTPQAETARCWVCRRSSTACGTCRNFRRSVAAQLGYCGLDRQRRPLAGDEIRACWEAAAPAPEVAPVAVRPSSESDPARTPVRRLEFVEVRSSVGAAASGAAGGVAVAEPVSVSRRRRGVTTRAVEPEPTTDSPPLVAATDAEAEPSLTVRPADPGWSLWSDAEL